jgi:hypothetical protein
MLFCIAVEDFHPGSLPAGMAQCPLCGQSLRLGSHVGQQLICSSCGVVGPATSAITYSTTPDGPRIIVHDSDIQKSPVGQALLDLLQQTQSQNKHRSQTQDPRRDPFQAYRKEIEQTHAEGFISKKDKLHANGKLEIGNHSEPKVSDNRTADSWVGIDNTNANLFKLCSNTILYTAWWPAQS